MLDFPQATWERNAQEEAPGGRQSWARASHLIVAVLISFFIKDNLIGPRWEVRHNRSLMIRCAVVEVMYRLMQITRKNPRAVCPSLSSPRPRVRTFPSRHTKLLQHPQTLAKDTYPNRHGDPTAVCARLQDSEAPWQWIFRTGMRRLRSFTFLVMFYPVATQKGCHASLLVLLF